MIHQHQSSYWTTRITDTFDQLYEESAERPKVMAIAVHPYISGMPHRIRHLKAAYDYINGFDGVVHWNGTQLLNWFQGQKKKT
jgi:allantoinase